MLQLLKDWGGEIGAMVIAAAIGFLGWAVKSFHSFVFGQSNLIWAELDRQDETVNKLVIEVSELRANVKILESAMKISQEKHDLLLIRMRDGCANYKPKPRASDSIDIVHKDD